MGPSASLTLEDYSTMASMQSTQIQEEASLILQDNAGFTQNGDDFILSPNCHMVVNDSSYFHAYLFKSIYLSF